ncbi:Magnesium transport protein CorA [Termitomyces sp. J132]|nr:Magnesium transport protein CorA [Termitomyces sp. J132]
MPRENSFSDSEGRSLTPDLDEVDEGPTSPVSMSVNAHRPTYSIPHVTQPSPRLLVNTRSLSKRSVLSKIISRSPTTQKTRPWPGNGKIQTPIERFRAAVRKVMALHRGTSYLMGNVGHVGAEPGVNPRRASANLLYGHIRQDCMIEVIDYSAVRSSFRRLTNKDLVNFLDDPLASEREPWVKVRWINIGGLSWDVLRAVSIKYDLHPLALEDIFHTRSQTRSKADYYTKHLFLRVLCHQLGQKDGPVVHTESIAFDSMLMHGPRSDSPSAMSEPDTLEKDAMREEDDDTMYDDVSGNMSRKGKKRGRFFPFIRATTQDLEGNLANIGSSRISLGKLKSGAAAKRRKQAKNNITLNALKQGDRVNVNVSPMFIFLLRDGTVISIHTVPNLQLTSPIGARLRQRDTGLRNSADPSLLVHALLDLIVDNALEVIDEFHTKINKFERAILLKPNVQTVQYLHILSGDLIMHKRTMEPIKTLIYGLRRYDLDRCQALIDMSDPTNAQVKVVGFMSHKTKIYLADVFDHTEYILSSLDMFAAIAENLIGYTFNLASYEMNQVMRRLTLATIIFLPLTLLTGYFGMNFASFWAVNEHSDLFFWEIALPVMAVVIPLFLWSDIKELFRYMKKKMATEEAVKVY